jgi:hypothetical protein
MLAPESNRAVRVVYVCVSNEGLCYVAGDGQGCGFSIFLIETTSNFGEGTDRATLSKPSMTSNLTAPGASVIVANFRRRWHQTAFQSFCPAQHFMQARRSTWNTNISPELRCIRHLLLQIRRLAQS